MEQTDETLPGNYSKSPEADDEDKPLDHAVLTRPFNKIALALSGGGFRAASYSIGTMSYLAQVKNSVDPADSGTLLDNVEFISSASGGTFAGMLYTARAKKGVAFHLIYHELLTFMEGLSLLEQALRNINNAALWEGTDKNRNFINAFAMVYDEMLFKKEKFGVFWQDNAALGEKNIEVCFNATEFYRGLSFRFQAGKYKSNPHAYPGKRGNNYIYFGYSAAALNTLKEIKLGDILAASSCFPAGFEPIVYPEDFSYPATNPRDKTNQQASGGLQTDELRRAMLMTDYDGKAKPLQTSFGLMDGGIDDNQGVYSAILADKRRRDKDPNNGFDLIMVTDVASYFMKPYIPPPPLTAAAYTDHTIGSIFGQLRNIYTGLTAALKWTGFVSIITLLSAFFLIAFAEQGKWTNIGYLLLSPSILLLLAVAFVMGYKAGNSSIRKIAGWLGATDKEMVSKLKTSLPAIQNFSDNSVEMLVHYLKQSPSPVLERMLKTRANSMLSMVLDINLKQTRRLIFTIFYGNFYGKEIWANRRVFNVIYELSIYNTASRIKALERTFYPKDLKPLEDGWGKKCIDLLTRDCSELNSIAENARTMGTTLWYDSADAGRMKAIVTCGQFTACCKLLEYALVTQRVIDIESDRPDHEKTILLTTDELALFTKTRNKLEADWKRFKTEPFFLYDHFESMKPTTSDTAAG